jgi:hypothetical protein
METRLKFHFLRMEIQVSRFKASVKMLTLYSQTLAKTVSRMNHLVKTCHSPQQAERKHVMSHTVSNVATGVVGPANLGPIKRARDMSECLADGGKPS